MSWCKLCNNYMLFPDRHQCPPAFVCQPADEGLYGDGNQITVHSRDAEGAAEQFAEQWDSDGDCEILRSGTGFEVKVTAPGGEVTYWSVCGESVPSYSADRSEEFPRDSDGSGEAGQTRSGAEGLDPEGDSAGRVAASPNA